MGAADSKNLSPSQGVEKITRVSSNTLSATNSCLEKLEMLQAAGPLLKVPTTESSLTEIFLRNPSLDSFDFENVNLDPRAALRLLYLYQEWQKDATARISKRQEDLGYKIEAVEALALKLLQRLTHSSSVMKTTAFHLEEARVLEDDLKDMKHNLKTVLERYEALCKKIDAHGQELSIPNVKQFTTNDLKEVRGRIHISS